MSQFEVELKFPVAEFDSTKSQLMNLGASSIGIENHRDTYFRHPSRNFVETREALRLRRVNDKPQITYKGPKQASGDSAGVKTRIELEWPLDPGDHDGSKMESLLKHLGFNPTGTVEKQRESYQLNWQDTATTVTFDNVKSLGTFIEIEQLASKDRVSDAQTNVLVLAKHLGLSDPEPRSYIAMLLSI